MTFQTVTPVKKVAWPHRCDWCDEEIPTGSPAMAYGGGEGNFHWRVWRHLECDEESANVSNDDLLSCSAGSFKRGTDEQR